MFCRIYPKKLFCRETTSASDQAGSMQRCRTCRVSHPTSLACLIDIGLRRWSLTQHWRELLLLHTVGNTFISAQLWTFFFWRLCKKILSMCKILRNVCAVFFSFVPAWTKKVGTIKCNFVQAGHSGWSRGRGAFRSLTGPSPTPWSTYTDRSREKRLIIYILAVDISKMIFLKKSFFMCFKTLCTRSKNIINKILGFANGSLLYVQKTKLLVLTLSYTKQVLSKVASTYSLQDIPPAELWLKSEIFCIYLYLCTCENTCDCEV